MIRKGEIAVYAVALMLVAAGYFNYVTFEKKSTPTFSEEIASTGDAVLVSNNEASYNTEKDAGQENDGVEVKKKEKKEEEKQSEDDGKKVEEKNREEKENSEKIEEEKSEEEKKNGEKIEEEKNIEAENGAENKKFPLENRPPVGKNETENYYASSKLDRDKMYAEMLSCYEGILNNSNVNEAQKTIATQEIAKINSNKNAIMVCENLIMTKGFDNCVIFINDKTVNVVVSKSGGLETKSVAQIQNIVSRELNIEIENIHITEK